MAPQQSGGNVPGPMDHRMHDAQGAQDTSDGESAPAWRHWGLMALCCLPMIAIVVVFIVGIWR